MQRTTLAGLVTKDRHALRTHHTKVTQNQQPPSVQAPLRKQAAAKLTAAYTKYSQPERRGEAAGEQPGQGGILQAAQALLAYLVVNNQLAVGCDDGVLSNRQLQQLAIEGLQLNRATSQGCRTGQDSKHSMTQ
jgi:hypothetical protein